MKSLKSFHFKMIYVIMNYSFSMEMLLFSKINLFQHEKLQNLRNEHTQNRYKQKFSSESNSNAWTQFPRKASGTPSNGLGRFALSLRPRKSKDLKDDSVYGFNPRSGYSYTPTDPGGFSSQVLPEADRSSTSFFSLNVNELVRNASEPHTEDTTAVSVSREILAHFQRKATRGLKKQIGELVEAEWRIFAVFLDRLFLFTFLGIGCVDCIAVFSYITS